MFDRSRIDAINVLIYFHIASFFHVLSSSGNILLTFSIYIYFLYHSTIGFMDRNRDAIPSELKQLMLTTSNVLLHKIFALDPENTKKNSRKSFLKADTVTTKFKSQLGSLMDTITGTDVQYVRCIKPNSVKSRQIFDRNMVRYEYDLFVN